MKSLELFKLDEVDHLVTPSDFDLISIHSSALSLFDDFKSYKALFINEKTKAVDAHEFMERYRFDYNIVVEDSGECVGIVSLEDLSDMRLIKAVSQGYDRDELLVCDVMIKRDQISAFDFDTLEHAHVIDVLETLKRNGLNYSLVVEHENHEIRGVISANEIAKRLRIPFELSKPPTFAEIFRIIHK